MTKIVYIGIKHKFMLKLFVRCLPLLYSHLLKSLPTQDSLAAGGTGREAANFGGGQFIFNVKVTH